MLRLFTNFIATTEQNQRWIPAHDSLDGRDVDPGGFLAGARIVPFQDEGDFEVQATRHFGVVGPPRGRIAWHALSARGTRLDLSDRPNR